MEGGCDFLIFAWLDRERRYIICSKLYMSDGMPNIRSRLRQESERPHAEPETLTLVINQSQAYELYYNCCDIVD